MRLIVTIVVGVTALALAACVTSTPTPTRDVELVVGYGEEWLFGVGE